MIERLLRSEVILVSSLQLSIVKKLLHTKREKYDVIVRSVSDYSAERLGDIELILTVKVYHDTLEFNAEISK